MKDIFASLCPSFLIIGYGNELRSDDGVGQRVSDTVATWKLPNVRALSVFQLTPELTENLATVNVAIFVDAYPILEERKDLGKITKVGAKQGI